MVKWRIGGSAAARACRRGAEGPVVAARARRAPRRTSGARRRPAAARTGSRSSSGFRSIATVRLRQVAIWPGPAQAGCATLTPPAGRSASTTRGGREVAVDHHPPLQPGRGVAADRAAQPVPLEQHQEDNDRQITSRPNRPLHTRSGVNTGFAVWAGKGLSTTPPGSLNARPSPLRSPWPRLAPAPLPNPSVIAARSTGDLLAATVRRATRQKA